MRKRIQPERSLEADEAIPFGLPISSIRCLTVPEPAFNGVRRISVNPWGSRTCDRFKMMDEEPSKGGMLVFGESAGKDGERFRARDRSGRSFRLSSIGVLGKSGGILRSGSDVGFSSSFQVYFGVLPMRKVLFVQLDQKL